MKKACVLAALLAAFVSCSIEKQEIPTEGLVSEKDWITITATQEGGPQTKTVLDEDLSVVDGIAFSKGDVADESPAVLDLLYRPIRNDFRGRVSIEAQVACINAE